MFRGLQIEEKKLCGPEAQLFQNCMLEKPEFQQKMIIFLMFESNADHRNATGWPHAAMCLRSLLL